MWVFGYGSLMWDGWEQDFGCLRTLVAELAGYQRAFNKASVRNWGTAAAPGPTLNLVPGNGACLGMAFEFPEEASAALHGYLGRREGRDFALRKQTIRLNGGEQVAAVVPIYEGSNLIHAKTTAEIAALVRRARGRDGPCTTYVIGLSDRLRELGIDDPAVTALRRAIERS